MTKMMIALAFIASAFTSVAFAARTSQIPGTKVSNPSWSRDRSYASTGSMTFGGGTYLHEIQTNLTSGTFNSSEQCKDCDSGTSIVVEGSYLRYLKDNFQVGGEGGISILSDKHSRTGDSETLFKLVGVGVYNLEPDMKSSIYGKAGVGLYPVLDGTDYKTQLGFFIGAGKRFSWFSNVSYTPEVRLTKAGDLDMAVDIHFINFSLLWN